MQTARLQSIALIGDSDIQGSCDDRFAPVKETFAANLNTGKDIGASVELFIDGEPIVDLWGGHFDGTYTRPWERDTIVQTFSTTKTYRSCVGRGRPGDHRDYRSRSNRDLWYLTWRLDRPADEFPRPQIKGDLHRGAKLGRLRRRSPIDQTPLRAIDSTDLPLHGASRCEPVNVDVRPRFRDVLTQFPTQFSASLAGDESMFIDVRAKRSLASPQSRIRARPPAAPAQNGAIGITITNDNDQWLASSAKRVPSAKTSPFFGIPVAR
jgi:hypothetical protein